jgi:4-oxalocrotonate tautomerase
MPLVRISLLKGRNEAHKLAIAEGVYASLREVFKVPENDKFVLFHEHDRADFVFDPSYLGIAHDDDLIMMQIAISEGRSIELKQALYKAIVERLKEKPGIEPRNVFINLVEVKKENWSFGDGAAQYA